MVRGVVPGLAVKRRKWNDRRSRKSQPPLGDLAVKGAVRQRGTSVYRGAWSTPPVLGTGNRWFESSYADEIKQEERFENSAFGARPVWLQRGIKRLNVPTNLEECRQLDDCVA